MKKTPAPATTDGESNLLAGSADSPVALAPSEERASTMMFVLGRMQFISANRFEPDGEPHATLWQMQHGEQIFLAHPLPKSSDVLENIWICAPITDDLRQVAEDEEMDLRDLLSSREVHVVTTLNHQILTVNRQDGATLAAEMLPAIGAVLYPEILEKPNPSFVAQTLPGWVEPNEPCETDDLVDELLLDDDPLLDCETEDARPDSPHE